MPWGWDFLLFGVFVKTTFQMYTLIPDNIIISFGNQSMI